MIRTCFMMFVFICFILDNADGRNNVKFEGIIENMTECQNPLPPFTKDRIILSEYKIHKNKGRIYLSGRNRVLTEVPFQNFSVSTYTIDDSGRRELKIQVQNLTCRSILSRLFLEYGNFRYVKNNNNCRLLKGSYTYKDFDVNKVLHIVPNWHPAGRVMYRSGLTLAGKTIYCMEIVISVKYIDSQ